MGDNIEKKNPVIYGSAGMARAGMIRTDKPKPKPEPEPIPEEVETIEEKPVEEEPEVTEEPTPDPIEEVVEEPPVVEEAPVVPEYKGHRAVVIGHTGAGNYGHGLDLIFHRLDGVRLDAISDENEDAVEEAQTRTGAKNAYPGYRSMLETESADLVCIAPHSTHERHAMVRAALEDDSHVITEAPFAQTLKEADELLSLAAAKSLSVAVAHPMRCDPHVLAFHARREEIIGDLLEMRLFGEMGARSGGEDLLINGLPLFDLVRLFSGEPAFVNAQINKDGVSAIAEDFHKSEWENYGPLLGDAIRAEFVMHSGVQVSYVSEAKMKDVVGPAGIEFVGSTGRMRLFAGAPVTMSLLKETDPAAAIRTESWSLWPERETEYHEQFDRLSGEAAGYRRVVHDWLEAIAEEREPASSGENALLALEMAHGIWQSGVTMKRAYFPLANRLHPLSEETV